MRGWEAHASSRGLHGQCANVAAGVGQAETETVNSRMDS